MRRSRPGDRPLPAVPRLRGHARRPVREEPRPRRAQVRPDARARRAADAGLLEHLAAIARRSRARGGAAARARRARRQAQPAHRLRSARLGPPRQSLSAGVADRRARRPSASRPDPRQLPHPLARRRSSGDRIDSRRADLLRPDGRRADPGDGRAAVGAPLPQLSRPRASSTSSASSSRCCARATPERSRSRSSTTSFARRRTGAPRSTRCARCSGSKARRAAGSRTATRRRGASWPASSSPIRRRRRRSPASPSSSSASTTPAPPRSRRCSRSSASSASAGIARSR